MPQYDYACPHGHREIRVMPVRQHQPYIDCPVCGGLAAQVISAPLLVKAAADVCYDSPIDGSPITSWEKRTEDLKRNGCREYDPGMKTDYLNRIKDSEASLEKSLSETVEEVVEKMPTAKRGKLYSELTEQGVTTDVTHSTYGG